MIRKLHSGCEQALKLPSALITFLPCAEAIFPWDSNKVIEKVVSICHGRNFCPGGTQVRLGDADLLAYLRP